MRLVSKRQLQGSRSPVAARSSQPSAMSANGVRFSVGRLLCVDALIDELFRHDSPYGIEPVVEEVFLELDVDQVRTSTVLLDGEHRVVVESLRAHRVVREVNF